MIAGVFVRRPASRRREITVIAVMNTLYALAYLQRVAVPGAIFNDLQSDLSLSPAGVAMLGAIFMYVYGGMQIVAGVLADTLGSLRMVVYGGVLLSVGSVFFPLSQVPAALYVMRFVTALGASLMYLALVKELDTRFREKDFSAMLGISVSIGYAGGLIGTVPFSAAADSIGWRSALLVAGIISCLATIAALVLFRNVYRERPEQPAKRLVPALGRILSNPRSYTVMYAYSVLFGVFMMMQATLGKKFLQDSLHFSSSTGAFYIFVLMLACIGALLFSGFVSKSIGNRRKPLIIAGAVSSVAAIGLMLPVASGEVRWALPAYLLLGASMMCVPVFVCAMKESNDPEHAGIATGVLNGTNFISTAVITTVAGLVLNKFSLQPSGRAFVEHYPPEAYTAIFTGCLVLAVSALVCSFFVPETWGRNICEQRGEVQ